MNVTCPTCGSQVSLPEGKITGFCGSCGSAVTAPAMSNPAAASSAPVVTAAKPAMNIKWLPIAIGVVAIAIVVLIIVLLTSGGNGTYKSAESKNLSRFMSYASLDNPGKGQEATMAISYKPGDDISDLVWENVGFDVADGITLSAKISALGETLLGDITGTLGEYDVHGVVSFDGNRLTVALPEITDYFLFAPLDMSDEELPKMDMKALSKTINNITDSYFKLTDEIAEVEKGAELSKGGVTIKADKYTIEFTGDDLADFMQLALDEVRGNDNLMDYIDQITGGYAEDFIEETESELDYIIDEVGNDTILRMQAWVKDDEIVARVIDRVYETDMTLNYYTLFDSKNGYVEFSGVAGGTEIKASGDFTKVSGKWDGSIEVGADSEYAYETSLFNITLDCTGMAIEDDMLIGKVAFDEMGVELNLDLSKKGKEQILKIDGSIMSYDIGELTVSASEKEISSLKLPSYDEDNGVNPDEIYYDDEMYDRYYDFMDDVNAYFGLD
jgi:hypothetical protein